MQVVYVGPHDWLDFPVLGVRAVAGNAVSVPDEVGEELLARGDFKRKAATRPTKNKEQ